MSASKRPDHPPTDEKAPREPARQEDDLAIDDLEDVAGGVAPGGCIENPLLPDDDRDGWAG